MSNLSATTATSSPVATFFLLTALYQVRENYAFDADGNPDSENPFWKCKGGNEYTVAENLSMEDVVRMGASGGDELVSEFEAASFADGMSSGPVFNDMYRESLITWSYDERSEAVLNKVLNIIASLSDWDSERDYLIYNASIHNMSENGMRWAIDTLIERNLIKLDGPHNNIEPGSDYQFAA